MVAMHSATNPNEKAMTSLAANRVVFAYYYFWGM
jgi:hypothetical protein